jgi:hypothetical protein
MEQELIKIITGQGPWAVLFVVMLLYIKKDKEKTQAESKEREERLMLLVEKNTDLIDKTTDKYDLVIGSINDLNKEFTGFRERWDRIEGKGRS